MGWTSTPRIGADQTTRKLRIRDRLKLSKGSRISELAFNAIFVRDDINLR